MKIALKVVGALLVLFGIADFASSYMETDLWGEIIGVRLPEIVWRFSAYAEMLIGYLLFQAGRATVEEEPSTNSEIV